RGGPRPLRRRRLPRSPPRRRPRQRPLSSPSPLPSPSPFLRRRFLPRRRRLLRRSPSLRRLPSTSRRRRAASPPRSRSLRPRWLGRRRRLRFRWRGPGRLQRRRIQSRPSRLLRRRSPLLPTRRPAISRRRRCTRSAARRRCPPGRLADRPTRRRVRSRASRSPDVTRCPSAPLRLPRPTGVRSCRCRSSPSSPARSGAHACFAGARPPRPRRSRDRAPLSSLPMRFYLTTPIYYVNSTPHIGHAYTTIAADILVRHHRQRGEETFFLTGVDEHADKVARVAAEQGLTPREYTDAIVGAWQELPRRLNATNDFFIRTSDDGHKRFVQEFLQRIYDNGREDIYQDVYAGWYCVGCEAFKTEDELVDGRCPDHGTEPEWLEERNWFFRLSAYQDELLALYDQRPDFVLPHFRANEARSFIQGGLRDFSISRATQTWGVPIPWDPDQVAYVWADALINYLSALSYAPSAAPGEDLSRFWPATHLLAKDILRFHCVYWPALLLAAGYEPPRQLFVHGYLNIDQQKISKSLGNVIDPLDLIDVYGADAV